MTTRRGRKKIFQCFMAMMTIGAMLLILSCATVPLTGRKELQLVPESQLLSMSFDQYSALLKKIEAFKRPRKGCDGEGSREGDR